MLGDVLHCADTWAATESVATGVVMSSAAKSPVMGFWLLVSMVMVGTSKTVVNGDVLSVGFQP